MLRSEELDRESFEDILKAAVDKIPKLYPQWTNFNEADPGITITELFAWFTEIQQYHLNVIGREHFLRYLKLLGCMPEREKPARTYLKLTARGGHIPRGTLFYADDIPFETEYAADAGSNSIASVTGGGVTLENRDGMLSSDIFFRPFGEDGRGDFTITLKSRPDEGELLGIYFSVEPVEGCEGHDPIGDNFIPYTELTCKGGSIVRDETRGFCRSGVLLTAAGAGRDRELVFSVKNGEYVVPPVLRRIVLGAVPAVQRRTLARLTPIVGDRRSFRAGAEQAPKELYGVDDEKRVPIKDFTFSDGRVRIVGKSFGAYESLDYDDSFAADRYAGETYGLCSCRLPVEPKGFLTDSVELYIEEPDGIYRWKRVDDFDGSGRYSRHFVYDRAASELVFGDGEKGMPPEGRVMIVGGAVSLGEGGSVKEGIIDSFNEKTSCRGVNITPAVGGREEQSIDECFAAARRMTEQPERCITLEDLERAVRRVPGVPVRRVKAFLDEKADNRIIIAVENVPDADRINIGCLINMEHYVLPRVVVGTKIEFRAPAYTDVHIFAELETDPYMHSVREMTEEALKRYFGAVGFGAHISINALNRYLYEIDWIKNVIDLDLSFTGGGAQLLPNGDYKLGSGCLPRVEQVTVIF